MRPGAVAHVAHQAHLADGVQLANAKLERHAAVCKPVPGKARPEQLVQR